MDRRAVFCYLTKVKLGDGFTAAFRFEAVPLKHEDIVHKAYLQFSSASNSDDDALVCSITAELAGESKPMGETLTGLPTLTVDGKQIPFNYKLSPAKICG